MGFQLVKSAIVTAAELDLGHPATRLLIYMASRAIDADRPPVYTAGRECSAIALGYRPTDQGFRALKKVTAELLSSGLLTIHRNPHRGRAAEYALRLPERAPADSPLYGKRGPEEGTQDAEMGTPDSPNGDPVSDERVPAEGPPMREEESREEGPPSRYCPSHPNGTSAPCGPCGDARRNADAWKPRRRPRPAHIHRYESSGYCSGCGIRSDAA